MLKKFISIALVIALINLPGVISAFANSNSEKELRLAAKVKENIQKLGTGESAKVKIVLKDNTKVEGYVSDIGEDSFTIVNCKTEQSTEVEYSQVKKVKGNNLSTGAKIAIGVGIAVVILAIAALANRKVCSNALCQ